MTKNLFIVVGTDPKSGLRVSHDFETKELALYHANASNYLDASIEEWTSLDEPSRLINVYLI